MRPLRASISASALLMQSHRVRASDRVHMFLPRYEDAFVRIVLIDNELHISQ